MTPDDPETVRGDCSFCGETVTGRHAIIHYETAGGDPCVWAECPSCGGSLTPPMLSKQFIMTTRRKPATLGAEEADNMDTNHAQWLADSPTPIQTSINTQHHV